MPIIDRQDATDVEELIVRVFAATTIQQRVSELQWMFSEKLDFVVASGAISLEGARKNVELPNAAERVARLDGVTVVYVPLDIPDSDRVRKREAVEAARLISNQLADDVLLVFTNTSCSQLHFIYPTFEGDTPYLRRIVIERDLKHRTAVQQLANIYHEWKHLGVLHAALEKAFDVEAVTSEFFREYKRVFDHAIDNVTGFEAGTDGQEAKRLYVQTLFNRLMFVYFISRKGWLEYAGDKDYLNALRHAYRATPGNTNFHTDRLRPLFFGGLNNQWAADWDHDNPAARELIGDVPFLNGGLFEKDQVDDQFTITVPDDVIDQVLDELFDRFNFTVMESTPFDVEVAVDPEMLGKVFEELVTGRHQTGSYYTPRPIVAFMCREALKGYLAGEVPAVSGDALRRFVDERDVTELNLNVAEDIREALRHLTVVDPACGSGAYLIGMMQELIDLESALYSEKLVLDTESLYEIKLRIIERNVYGADIDPFAVNIAMLRLWLSLAIDYDGERPPPLPNLDFKIVCGDSLTSPDPAPEHQLRLFADTARGLRERLERAKAGYMRAIGPEKATLKNQIDEMEAELKAALDDRSADDNSVEWRVQFAEVFDRRQGFDIVIANPPYRRQEGLSTRKQDLQRLYPEVYAGTADYHVYFYNRSVQLLRQGGELAFITSNKYMRAGYGEKIREYLPEELTISQVVDFGDLPVFLAASYPAIVVGRKSAAPDDHALQVADLAMPVRRELKAQDLSVNTETVNRAMDQLPALLERHGVIDYPQVLLRKNGWILEDPKLVRLFERLMNQGTPLGEFVQGRMYYGIKTGLNEAFVIGEAKRAELINADPRSADLIKPWLRGRDIRRWKAEWSGQYVIFTRRGVNIDHFPAIRAHLARNRHPSVGDNGKMVKGLEPRGGTQFRKRGTYEWYEIQDNVAYYSEFAKPKIIWPRNTVPKSMQFALDEAGVYINDKGYILPEAPLWLLALLNSSLMLFMVSQLCTKLRGGWLELKSDSVVERLPIEKLTRTGRHVLEEIANATSRNPHNERLDEMDEIIYSEYGLTSSEVDDVKTWHASRHMAV